jgi:hypothetical protein
MDVSKPNRQELRGFELSDQPKLVSSATREVQSLAVHLEERYAANPPIGVNVGSVL